MSASSSSSSLVLLWDCGQDAFLSCPHFHSPVLTYCHDIKQTSRTNAEAFLLEEGLTEELTAIVAKERIAFQLQQAMKKKRITKVKLAELMDTSRTQIDRILDPTSGNITIETLQRVARIVGRELRVELV